MNEDELTRVLWSLLDDEAPPSVLAGARPLFRLRSVSDELAELVEMVDDEPASGRTLAFASESHRLSIAVDDRARAAVGRIEPAGARRIRLTDTNGDEFDTLSNTSGVFEIRSLPAGRVQVVVASDPTAGRPSVQTVWWPFIDPVAPGQAGADFRPGGEAPVKLRPRDRVTRLRPRQSQLDPPGVIRRTLAPAAQQGARQLPLQRWSSAGSTLSVSLEENQAGRLIVSVVGGDDVGDDLLVSIAWSTTTAAGGPMSQQLVTPIPPGAAEERSSTYDVGSALDLSEFHLLDVRLLLDDDATPELARMSLGQRPYGNAVRAWYALADRLDDPVLRSAVTAALDGR